MPVPVPVPESPIPAPIPASLERGLKSESSHSRKCPLSQECVSVVCRKLICPQVRSRMGAATGFTAPGCAAWTAAAAMKPPRREDWIMTKREPGGQGSIGEEKERWITMVDAMIDDDSDDNDGSGWWRWIGVELVGALNTAVHQGSGDISGGPGTRTSHPPLN